MHPLSKQEEQRSEKMETAIYSLLNDIKDFAAKLEVLLEADDKEVEKRFWDELRGLENGESVREKFRLNAMSFDWANREMKQLMEENNKLRADLKGWTAQPAEVNREI